MRKTLSVMVAVLILLSLGCASASVNLGVERAQVGELQRETQTVELSRVADLGDGQELRVEIMMGAGDLTVEGDADELLEAEFAYNIADWKPQVELLNDRLSIRQPPSRHVPFNESVRYEWNLNFNATVPLLFRADIGAGSGVLNLGSLNVRTVDLKLGAGDMEVDLTDNRTLERLDANLGAGTCTLDLRGEWGKTVDVNVSGGIGDTTIYLPENMGVRVRIDKGLGSVETRGLHREGNDFVNDLYGKSEATLYLNIQAGIGQITLMGAE